MSLRINTNVDALNAYRNLSTTQNSMSTSLQRLSSGLRINKAADDAAGLAISQGLQSQIGGITVALRNTQDGINVVQTADGALNETQSILQRMRDLAVQSANDSNDDNSRKDIQKEVTALSSELDRIAGKTTFNNVNLLDGTFNGKQFQVGYAANDTIGVDIASTGAARAAAAATTAKFVSTAVTYDATLKASTVTVNGTAVDMSGVSDDASFKTALQTALGSGQTVAVASGVVTITAGTAGAAGNVTVAGLTQDTTNSVTGADAVTAVNAGSFGAFGLGVSSVDMTTQSGAESAIGAIDTAIQSVSTSRASLGALQNRFQHTINNLSVTQQNLQASNSAITDTDMAQEMTNFTRAQVLSQAGTAMLAQANQASQSVLKLLQ
ncbi:MAG: flagellin N-terminal helical domain-containing protein [Marmoricola sp.]